MLGEKLLEYEKRFGDNFPIMCFTGVTDEEIEKVISQALKDNKPYVMDFENEVVY